MAAVDYFIRFDGIEGESTDEGHKGEIEVESWSWGATHARAAQPRGGSAGKVSMQDFHFVTRLSKASPVLLRACTTGRHIPQAVLSARKAGASPQDYLTLGFSDVFVSSYQTGASEDDDGIPTDQVSFNFTKIEVEYRQQSRDGKLGAAVQFGYDLKTNKAL
jgi:type VI secretion system secreted protein Hcp